MKDKLNVIIYVIMTNIMQFAFNLVVIVVFAILIGNILKFIISMLRYIGS